MNGDEDKPKFNPIIDKVTAEEIYQRYNLGQSRITAGNYYYRNSTSSNVLWTAQNSSGNPSSWGTGY